MRLPRSVQRAATAAAHSMDPFPARWRSSMARMSCAKMTAIPANDSRALMATGRRSGTFRTIVPIITTNSGMVAAIRDACPAVVNFMARESNIIYRPGSMRPSEASRKKSLRDGHGRRKAR